MHSPIRRRTRVSQGARDKSLEHPEFSVLRTLRRAESFEQGITKYMVKIKRGISQTYIPWCKIAICFGQSTQKPGTGDPLSKRTHLILPIWRLCCPAILVADSPQIAFVNSMNIAWKESWSLILRIFMSGRFFSSGYSSAKSKFQL